MLGDHLSKWCNAGAPLAGKSACIPVAGIPGDLPGGRNCWCQTEQAPLAMIPAGNCKIPAGIPAAMNSVHSRRYTGRCFLWLQPITWQLLSLATPPTLKGTLYESKMAERRPSKRDFDTELIECVKKRPILWDSRLDDYKLH